MLTPLALQFVQIVLAIHIAATVVGFGVIFAYPLIFAYGTRLDPSHLGWFHRIQEQIGKRLIMPGLTVLVIAGIYLASDLHQWSKFYVGWGMIVAVIIGALGGAFFAPRERRLAELADRDVAASGDGPVRLSPEYRVLSRQVAVVGNAAAALILVTIVIMVAGSP